MGKFLLQSVEDLAQQAIIKVIGLGGGGSNAVDHMLSEIDGVEFMVANTDQQALKRTKVSRKIQFGLELTKGLGAGADPIVGRDAAIENEAQLVEPLADADMVFVTAGLGGGTGTGAAPVVARAIKKANPHTLVVAVVTTPFGFEGAKRMNYAEAGHVELKQAVDSLITIPNEKILTQYNKLSVKEAYAKVNDVLFNAVQGISNLVLRPGLINVDFADVRKVMSEAGSAMMGSGSASGDDRAERAMRDAIENPLLADVNVTDAKGLLVNVTASSDMSVTEWTRIGQQIEEIAADDAETIVGQVFDDELGDELRVTIVATGLNDPDEAAAAQSSRREERHDCEAPGQEVNGKDDNVVDLRELPPGLVRNSNVAFQSDWMKS